MYLTKQGCSELAPTDGTYAGARGGQVLTGSLSHGAEAPV